MRLKAQTFCLDVTYTYCAIKCNLGWYTVFLLKFDLEFLVRKTAARLNFNIDLTTLHIHPGL